MAWHRQEVFRGEGMVCGVWCVVCGVWCVVCGLMLCEGFKDCECLSERISWLINDWSLARLKDLFIGCFDIDAKAGLKSCRNLMKLKDNI